MDVFRRAQRSHPQRPADSHLHASIRGTNNWSDVSSPLLDGRGGPLAAPLTPGGLLVADVLDVMQLPNAAQPMSDLLERRLHEQVDTALPVDKDGTLAWVSDDADGTSAAHHVAIAARVGADAYRAAAPATHLSHASGGQSTNGMASDAHCRGQPSGDSTPAACPDDGREVGQRAQKRRRVGGVPPRQAECAAVPVALPLVAVAVTVGSAVASNPALVHVNAPSQALGCRPLSPPPPVPRHLMDCEPGRTLLGVRRTRNAKERHSALAQHTGSTGSPPFPIHTWLTTPADVQLLLASVSCGTCRRPNSLAIMAKSSQPGSGSSPTVVVRCWCCMTTFEWRTGARPPGPRPVANPTTVGAATRQCTASLLAGQTYGQMAMVLATMDVQIPSKVLR